MENVITHTLKYVTYILTKKQKSSQSFEDHNSEYVEDGKLDVERACHKKYDKENKLKEIGFSVLTKKHKFSQMNAVDIGSGAGYFSGKFSQIFEKVYAIEPSTAAINISKTILNDKKYKNIQWINGFAEENLKKLDFSKKKHFFFTGCVLSHLTDDATAKICAQLKDAKVGSVLLFCECHGKEYHRYMWHVRTQAWWQTQLPGWKINFHNNPIQNKKDRHMIFDAVKVK